VVHPDVDPDHVLGPVGKWIDLRHQERESHSIFLASSSALTTAEPQLNANAAHPRKDTGSAHGSLPGFPTIPPNVVVPAKVGSQPGTKTVQLSPPPTVAGDYPYTPDCCDKETNPVIKVQ
jgi:hypothetical protein